MTDILDLTQETTPLGTDAIYIVIDPAGTPEDRYILLSDLLGSVQAKVLIDVTAAEAFLVRKDADGGDIFLVDTTNSEVEITGLIAKTKAVFNSEVGYDEIVDNGNSSTAKTIDWTAGNVQKVTLTGDCTFTFTAPTKVGHLTLVMIGDGTARSLTWPATCDWGSETEPTWTGGSGDKNIVSMLWDGTDYIISGRAGA